MLEDSAIPLRKQQSILQKEIKVDVKSLVFSLTKAGINLGFGKWDDLAENGIDILESLGLDKKPAEVAGLLIIRSIMQGIGELLKDHQDLFNKTLEKNDEKEFYQTLNTFLDNNEIIIDRDFFERPQNLPLLEKVQKGFAKWLELFLDKAVDAENISHRLPSYFIFALNKEWLENSKEYASLKEELETPFTSATKREIRWLKYRPWLQKQVDEPVFLETFSLKQIYIPLRGYYEQAEKDNNLTRNAANLVREDFDFKCYLVLQQ
ncbi:pentapeptide repeat-containing protein [Gloeothece citriformis PCC 7424]|uniref:Pentapeptide repeat-containing protein n=1 Tax=Gloeothece citriformis (strain PCC 7424) TaxID=65393 RepID=B7K8F9_GLOC7|nr:hypothetical protein [Gloeothece citriformis]ACK69919.1 pentapeptide repeat-containing protein [Gloeothece citriformis PCC 7424]